MSEPFVGEIRIVGFNFPPRNWADCDGQLMDVSQNQTLFSLLGTIYGGDGRTTFALPDLRGRVPMHEGQGAGLTDRRQGVRQGSETNTLNLNHLPNHAHTGRVVTTTQEGDRNDPAGAYMARPEDPLQPYGGAAGGTMAGDSVQIDAVGNGLPVDNMQPFLVLRFVIALIGLFPSRN